MKCANFLLSGLILCAFVCSTLSVNCTDPIDDILKCGEDNKVSINKEHMFEPWPIFVLGVNYVDPCKSDKANLQEFYKCYFKLADSCEDNKGLFPEPNKGPAYVDHICGTILKSTEKDIKCFITDMLDNDNTDAIVKCSIEEAKKKKSIGASDTKVQITCKVLDYFIKCQADIVKKCGCHSQEFYVGLRTGDVRPDVCPKSEILDPVSCDSSNGGMAVYARPAMLLVSFIPIVLGYHMA